MKIERVIDENQKSEIVKDVLDQLPEWFGNEESKADYIVKVKSTEMWKAVNGDEAVGFISVKVHHEFTGDIFVFGIKKEYHHQGIGKQLLKTAEDYLKSVGCKRIIIKTLSDTVNYPPYLSTLKFYLANNYEKFITFTEFWDPQNPCLMLIKDKL